MRGVRVRILFDMTFRAKRVLGKIVLCVMLFSFIATEGVWGESSVHPNPFKREGAFAPSVQALTMTDEGILYAGTFGLGVFVSHDQGDSWVPFNAGLGDPFILCLTTDSKGQVYAGTVRGGIFRTTEDGLSWESISEGLRRSEIKSLLAHPQGIYAGTGHGVYQWDEPTRTWLSVAKGLDQILVSSLVMMDDQRLFAGTAGQGVQWLDTTHPGTSTWQRVQSDFIDAKERLEHNHIRILARNQEEFLFAGTQDGGIFRSVDHGESWHVFGRALPNDSIRGIVTTNGGVFVATGRGIYTTSSPEDKWTSVNNGLTERAIQVMILTPKGALYVGTSSGVFRSHDYGKHWVNVSEGFGTLSSMPRPYF